MINKIEQKIGEAIGLKISHSKVWSTNSKRIVKSRTWKGINNYERGTKQATKRNGGL